eukprot:3877452-Pyramimonas_sp.AAC.1
MEALWDNVGRGGAALEAPSHSPSAWAQSPQPQRRVGASMPGACIHDGPALALTTLGGPGWAWRTEAARCWML